MIIGSKISPHAAMVRTTATCFLSQKDVLAITNLETFVAKDLLGTIDQRKLVLHPCCQRVLKNVFRSFKIWHTSLRECRELLAN